MVVCMCVYVCAHTCALRVVNMITCYNAVMARVVMRVLFVWLTCIFCGKTRKGSGEIKVV